MTGLLSKADIETTSGEVPLRAQGGTNLTSARPTHSREVSAFLSSYRSMIRSVIHPML